MSCTASSRAIFIASVVAGMVDATCEEVVRGRVQRAELLDWTALDRTLVVYATSASDARGIRRSMHSHPGRRGSPSEVSYSSCRVALISSPTLEVVARVDVRWVAMGGMLDEVTADTPSL